MIVWGQKQKRKYMFEGNKPNLNYTQFSVSHAALGRHLSTLGIFNFPWPGWGGRRKWKSKEMQPIGPGFSLMLTYICSPPESESPISFQWLCASWGSPTPPALFIIERASIFYTHTTNGWSAFYIHSCQGNKYNKEMKKYILNQAYGTKEGRPL